MTDKLPKSYLVAWFAALVVTFAPMLYSPQRNEYLNFLPGIVSIIILIIIDQYNSAEQRAKFADHMISEYEGMRSQVFSECQRAITGAQVVSTFSLLEAHHYVAANAARAKRIFNTRLGDSGSESKNVGYMAARNRQDEGFMAAIQKGYEYNLVFDVTHQASVKEFLDRVEKQHGAKHAGGIVRTSPVDSRGTPLLQFIVLEYQEVKECLVGYGLGGDITATPDIYLIRNDALCDYLRRVHESYIRMLSPKAH
jgi:hypothetical protein